jgi:hypothetical membrane protein
MKRQISYLSSLLLVFIYVLCTLLALIKFPAAYSPLTNWLSDLGSPAVNPQGWFFYNIGITCAGILFIVFFLGFSVWKKADNKKQHIMLRLAQGFGMAGGLCMILGAVFPINISGIHSFFFRFAVFLDRHKFCFRRGFAGLLSKISKVDDGFGVSRCH